MYAGQNWVAEFKFRKFNPNVVSSSYCCFWARRHACCGAIVGAVPRGSLSPQRRSTCRSQTSRIVIQYRTENLHIVPVFGPAALAVSPRIGQLHVGVDDATRPGRHKLLIELVNAKHQATDRGTVQVTILPAKPHPEVQ